MDEVIAEKMKMENLESVLSGDYAFLYEMLVHYNLHSDQHVDLTPTIDKLHSLVSEKHITFGVLFDLESIISRPDLVVMLTRVSIHSLYHV